jgi:integrase
MAYQDIRAFIAKLRERTGVAALALEFVILTAARAGEATGARWSEINIEEKLWTVPAVRMKAGRAHAVPLSDRACQILREMGGARVSDYVFPGHGGAPLSADALQVRLRRVRVEDATAHGMRSAFRDWCGNETSFPREVIEHALAHGEGDATKQAYRRGTALAKRRELMAAWAAYIEPGDVGGNVVKLRA